VTPPPASYPSPSGISELRILRALLLFTAFLTVAWFVHAARVVIAPFATAAFLAYITNPVVNFLEVRGVRRSSAVMGLYLVFVILLGSLAYSFFNFWGKEIPRFQYQWPQYLQQVNSTVIKLQESLRAEWPRLGASVDLPSLVDRGMEWVGTRLKSSPLEYLSTLGYAGLNIVLVPFVAFYLLKGGPAVFQRVMDACPGRWMEKFMSLFHKADEVVGNYLRGVLLDAAVVGGMAALGLAAMGVHYALLLGALVMLLNFVPYVGALIGAVAAILTAFLQFQTVWAPVRVAILFAALRFLDDWVFQPMILRRAVDLHPAALVLALLCGGEVWGFWGLVLAVPVVCVAKETVVILVDWYRSERGLTSLPVPLARAAAKVWVV
jgi:predicted PurR-regulated permease PerM